MNFWAEISFYNLFKKQNSKDLLNTLIEFCKELKYREIVRCAI